MRQKARAIVYVCSAVKEGKLISSMIETKTMDDSYVFFEKENGIKPQVVLGPFYKKRTSVLDKNCEIKFKPDQSKRAIYNGWYVTAMILSSPAESAYLFYDRRVDGQKIPKPNLTIVNTKDLQDIK